MVDFRARCEYRRTRFCRRPLHVACDRHWNSPDWEICGGFFRCYFWKQTAPLRYLARAMKTLVGRFIFAELQINSWEVARLTSDHSRPAATYNTRARTHTHTHTHTHLPVSKNIDAVRLGSRPLAWRKWTTAWPPGLCSMTAFRDCRSLVLLFNVT